MTLVRGVSAALRSAFVVRGPAFAALLSAPVPAHHDDIMQSKPVALRADRAARVAFATLRVLRHAPGWRNTCLYRAVAECLVLRGLGLPATVRLGVARQLAPAMTTATATTASPAIAAHAWVECPGHRCRSADGGEAEVFAPLRRPSPGDGANLWPAARAR